MNPHRFIRVTKTFTFEMAHALAGYDGECKNLHGHSYRLHVTLRGVPKNDPGLPEDGMVMDFKLLKRLVKVAVLDRFDHALAMNENCPPVLSAMLAGHFEKTIFLPFQPTCENLTLHFVEKIMESLPPDVELFNLKLEETATSSAEWCCEDGNLSEKTWRKAQNFLANHET